jgi:hypothetical protein
VRFQNIQLEKVDGSLAILYYFNGNWEVASEETPDGSDEVIQLLTEDKLYYYSKRPCYNGNAAIFSSCLKFLKPGNFLMMR